MNYNCFGKIVHHHQHQHMHMQEMQLPPDAYHHHQHMHHQQHQQHQQHFQHDQSGYYQQDFSKVHFHSSFIDLKFIKMIMKYSFHSFISSTIAMLNDLFHKNLQGGHWDKGGKW